MADMEPGRFQELLDEAKELDIDTTDWTPTEGDVDRLKMRIARRTEEIAREAAAKHRLEQAEIEAEESEKETIRSVFDETMANTRGVLVRQVEWTEWIPVGQDEHEARLTLANGFTGFEAGEQEKVLTVDAVGTQIFKSVEDEGLTRRFMLYAFKATLAQNVHTSLVATLVEAQGSNQEGESQVKRPSGIITPDGGPNRQQRRHPGGG